jgi:hypothetical protein
MDSASIKKIRDYTWKYFALHADQRIKTFNFYILLTTFAVGGMLTILKDATDSTRTWLLSPIAFLLAFLSYIFWKLDERNRRLVRHGGAALKLLEDLDATLPPNEGNVPHLLRILTSEEHSTKQLPRHPQADLIEAHMTYSQCFNAVFLVIGASSVVAGFAALIFKIK